MKNLNLQNLEAVRTSECSDCSAPEENVKKELPSRKPEGSPQKAPVQDPYGTDDPDCLDVRAASATDCTGLIPFGTDSDAELESYAEVYHYPADIFHG